MDSPYIVAVGGMLRANSSTESHAAVLAAQRAGARTGSSAARPCSCPCTNPAIRAQRRGRELVAELALADGIVLGSPGYHGSISGLVKNALDYAEDLRLIPPLLQRQGRAA
jgi:FMN reductase